MPQNISLDSLTQVNNLELLASQVVEGFITGLHKSPFHGFSVEFAEHRIYNTGESTRHIDWKLFARTDKLFVKRYEEETNLRCQIVLDTSASMFYPQEQLSKIQFSIYAAASLMHLLRKQRDANGLSLFDEDIYFHSDCKVSLTHLRMLFNQMDQVLNKHREIKQSNIAASLHQLADRLHRRSLVILFTDMFNSSEKLDELFSALQHLRYNKHEVVLFNVNDNKTEHEFEFSNRPYLFIDSETDERVKLFPAQVKEQFVQALAAYKQEIKLKCAQFKIDFVEANIGNDFNQILLPFLIKRSKMV
jgi:uncharacterized protein (DUF58 family)